MLLVTFLGLLAILDATRRVGKHPKAIPLAIRTAGVVLWPFLSSFFVSPCASMLPATAWLVGIWLVDACLLLDSPSPSGGFHIEPSSLAGLSFGLAAMAGNTPKSEHSRLFLYAILAAFLVAMPRHDLEKTSPSAVVVENVQRTLLHYCIAMLVTAVQLTRLGEAAD